MTNDEKISTAVKALKRARWHILDGESEPQSYSSEYAIIECKNIDKVIALLEHDDV